MSNTDTNTNTDTNRATPQPHLVASPFAAPGAGSALAAHIATAGAQQNQSRELAETQARYMMAERFPRDERVAMDRILNAFSRPKLAEKAAYQFARGGTDITGPSIRAAEAIAQQWGNMDSGWREIARGSDASGVPFSEVEAFCIDLQARNVKRLQFIVRHWRDTKQGGYKLKDERDVYELCANQAQRRVRACILASIPGDVTDAAMDQSEVTLKATADTSPAAMAKLVEAFAGMQVSREQIEKRIQRRLDAIAPAQVVALRRIYASLRDDISTPDDWFEVAPARDVTNTGAATGASALAGALDATKGASAARRAARASKQAATPEAPVANVANVDAETGEITLDPAQLRSRIAACPDLDVLALLNDDVLTLPEGDTKHALLIAIAGRTLALSPRTSTREGA